MRSSGMRTLAMAAAFFAASLLTSTGGAQTGPLSTHLLRAVYSDGRVWLLSNKGELSSVPEGSDKRTLETVPNPILDMCRRNGEPMTVACASPDCGNWLIQRHSQDGWRTDFSVATMHDDLVAMNCGTDRVTLLTNRRLIDASSGGQAAIYVHSEFRPGTPIVTHDSADYFFVGIDIGEFGGGLWRIDRRTGVRSLIESKHSGDGICDALLDERCTSVNAIVEEPGHPGCIAVATGIVHMMMHGSIVEVCSDEVKLLYSHNVPSQWGDMTTAFFGLMVDGETLVAAGYDGLYRIKQDGSAETTKYTVLKRRGCAAVSFELPGLVMVSTAIYAENSVSGCAPMVVRR